MRTSVIRVLALVLVAGCTDATPSGPDPPVDPLFDRYVALGNSITAGFQSGGIHEDFQRAAYPVLLADRMRTPFGLPLLRLPGCPPPLIDGLTGERPEGTCALRATPIPPRVQNLAVPGAAVVDPLDNLGSSSSPNLLTQFILGGRTQIEAAEDLRPTFASVWIGNNDVLGAALAGVVDPESLTSVESFREAYSEILDRLEAAGALGGILFAVVDVTLIPHMSTGAAYWLASESLPPGFEVHVNCAPSDVLVPAAHALEEYLRPALAGQLVTLDCAGDPRLLDDEEIQLLRDRVAAFNAVIRAEADTRGWAHVDPNPLLVELRGQGEIPEFPQLDRPGALFGDLFSLDGIHPNDALHGIIADQAIEAINRTWGVLLPPIVQ